jgi:hypothetical protein
MSTILGYGGNEMLSGALLKVVRHLVADREQSVEQKFMPLILQGRPIVLLAGQYVIRIVGALG